MSVKKERRNTSYHRLLVESRKNNDGVHYHHIGNNETMCLNLLKHIIKGIPYKNVECQKLLKETLKQYKNYMEQVANGDAGRPMVMNEGVV